ncbi:hypothetical protein [Sphingomonas arenae]|nr:hypothetical protein [Sphingomonas arenae]
MTRIVAVIVARIGTGPVESCVFVPLMVPWVGIASAEALIRLAAVVARI